MAAARKTALIAVLLPLLAACEPSAETSAPAGKRADGEVLGGTISDGMIPLEELQSQSPPLRPAPGDDAAPSGTPDEGASSEDAAGGELAPQPAATAEAAPDGGADAAD